MTDKIKQDISIGANLKRLRKNAKLSQEQVSAKLDLMGLSTSREIISLMESSATEKVSIRVSVLLALKEIYHVDTFDEFFRDL